MYDIEVYADKFEAQEAYRLECNAEQALENAAAEQVLSDLEQQARDLLERMDKHLEGVHALLSSMNTSTEQTEEETRMFEEWLS